MISILMAALALFAQASEPNPFDDEEEIYPVEYRGVWAPTAAACRDEFGEEVIRVGRTKIWAYESDSKLLKLTPEFLFTAPNGDDAKSVIALIAERGETEVGIGKIRLTLSRGKLFTSRVDLVTDDEQWKYGNIKC